MKIERLEYPEFGRMIGIKLGYGPSIIWPEERHWNLWLYFWDRGFWIYINPTLRECRRVDGIITAAHGRHIECEIKSTHQ